MGTAACAGRACSPSSVPQPARPRAPAARPRRCLALQEGDAGEGLPWFGSHPGSSSVRFSPQPRSREGIRGNRKKEKGEEKPTASLVGSPATVPPPQRPASAASMSSGPPVPAFCSAGPHARPAWAPGAGTEVLDGPRTKPRPRPDPALSVRQRGEPSPGQGAAEFSRGGWESKSEGPQLRVHPPPHPSHGRGQT